MSDKIPISKVIRRYYSFRWFLDDWSVNEKWLYVAMYVILFNIGLIPILGISEKAGLLVEGSSLSLGVLVLLLLLWFVIYQPVINCLMDIMRRRNVSNDDV